jgi:purine nucleosidase
VDWHKRLGGRPNARIVLDVDQARFGQLIASALGNPA